MFARWIASVVASLSLAHCGGPTGTGPDGSRPDADIIDAATADVTFGVPGNPPADLASCMANPATASPNSNFCTASYLGGPGADTAAAIEFADDGTVVFAGDLPGEDLGQTAVALMGGGAGAIVRMRPSGASVLSITRVGASVSDMEIRAGEGSIAVAGAFGVALLSPDASALRWHRALEGAARVSVGSDGTVAVVRRGGVTVFDGAGQELRQIALMDTAVNDVAVYGRGALVIVTGFNQVSGNLQWPFIRAYRYDGTEAWADYRYTRADGLTSDTRGLRVAIGRDQNLYYGGRSDGAVSAHMRDPQRFEAQANIVRTDRYSETFNWNGAAPLAFIARLDPSNGALERGVFLAPRLSNGRGNGATIEAITADETGAVLVGGGSACCIENTPPRTINGLPSLEGYAGGGFFAVLSRDFRARLHWNAFQNTTTRAVAYANGALALALQQSLDRTTMRFSPVLTVTPRQASPRGGESEAFFAIGRAFR